MAVVSVREVTNRTGERDMTTRKRYTRVFQVLADSPTDGAQLVREDPGLPAYGDPWLSIAVDGVTVLDQDLDARCVQKNATQTDADNFQNWTVNCEYAGIGDPTFEPPVVNWTHEKYQITENVDAIGQPVVNAAGDFFAGGMTRDRTRYVVTIQTNVATFDPILAESFKDTTNAAVFLADRHPPGFGIGTCKLDSLQAEPVYYPDYDPVNMTDIHYWRRTAKVAVDSAGWEAVFLNAGFQCLVIPAGGGAATRRKCIDPNTGAFASTPQPLASDGTQLPVGGTPTYTDGEDGRPGPFVKYKLADWTILDLDY